MVTLKCQINQLKISTFSIDRRSLQVSPSLCSLQQWVTLKLGRLSSFTSASWPHDVCGFISDLQSAAVGVWSLEYWGVARCYTCKALKSLWLLSPKKHFPVSSLPGSTPCKSSRSVAHYREGSLNIRRESEWVMWALFLCFFLRHFLGYFCTFFHPI